MGTLRSKGKLLFHLVPMAQHVLVPGVGRDEPKKGVPFAAGGAMGGLAKPGPYRTPAKCHSQPDTCKSTERGSERSHGLVLGPLEIKDKGIPACDAAHTQAGSEEDM